ncbi:P-loop containing nucleoside triphosphate hydrolase protein [Gymnopilus junonius]|uniref:P-loop containing nucleoside triphosphate hydrolase protein n=1 Tax=Gymnopilus junonius TaxID=109634 RepID=A0A9P5NT26_GYMJU|nr:P-loop containing nucleoside triphosphate hydrolase protein [Gymnopilus junonius]
MLTDSVMGATGAGKSFFINTLLKNQKMEVGTDLRSCTTELGFGYMENIQGHPLLDKHPIVLVDTPGFDDTFETDFTILEKIAEWLKNSYKEGAKLGGVIYLHDISAPRFFSGTARRNLQMFRSLCGEDVLDNVVLGTTKWVLKVPDSELRHEQLKADYWKPLIDKGAHALRFDNSFQSGWSLIDALLSPRIQHTVNEAVLQIQKELVDEKKIIPETEAGKELRYTLQEILNIQKKIQALDRGGGEEIRAQRQEAQQKVKILASQIQKLKIPLSRRLRKLLGF